MRINSVELVNFRIHASKKVEFTHGINLLLGENGRGKSSILEAIGITLFGSAYRDGNFKGQGQCIKYGEKKANIKIEFLGNDGEEYVVENELKSRGTGKFTLYAKNEPDTILSGKDEVNERLKVLVGVTGELKDIYDNIIVAKQNEFINVYKQKDTERQKLFDKIFETDIYRKIFDGQGKEVFDKYKERLDLKIGALHVKRESVEDIDYLKKEKVEKSEVLAGLTEKKLLKSSEIEKISCEIDEIVELQNKMKNSKIELSSTLGTFAMQEKNLNEKKEETLKAMESKKIVDENKDNFEKYNTLTKSLESLELELKIKEREANEFQKVSQNIFELENSIKKSQIKDELIKLTPVILEEERLRKSLDEKNTLLKSNVESFERVVLELENSEKTWNKAAGEKLKVELEQCEALEKESRKLSGAISEIGAILKNNSEAHEKLKGAVCPYLGDSCKNLEGKNIGDYFKEKESKLLEEKRKLENESAALLVKVNMIPDLKVGISRFKDLEKKIEDLGQEIEKSKLKVELVKKDLEIVKLSYDIFKDKNGDKESLLINKTKLESEMGVLQVGEFENIESKEVKLVEFKNRMESLKMAPEKFEEIKKTIGMAREELKKYESSYRLTLENIERGNKLGNLEEQCAGIQNEISALQNVINSKKESIENLEKALKEKRVLDELEDVRKELRKEYERLNIEFGKSEEEVKGISLRIEKVGLEQESILNLGKEIRKIEEKMELTKKFRDNIKDMGTKVSENILREISFYATENFRKITGRGEQVIWSNETSPYEVALKGGEQKIIFEQLSGGEQVAVAISIRGAMARRFSSAKFAIYDEPTNNLDVERRRSLADNIGEILEDLDQAIIVTHDDTFREMAEKVVEV